MPGLCRAWPWLSRALLALGRIGPLLAPAFGEGFQLGVGLVGRHQHDAAQQVAALNSALVRAVQSPEVSKTLLEAGAIPRVTSPEEFSAFIRTETERWTGVVRSSGIKLD